MISVLEKEHENDPIGREDFWLRLRERAWGEEEGLRKEDSGQGLRTEEGGLTNEDWGGRREENWVIRTKEWGLSAEEGLRTDEWELRTDKMRTDEWELRTEEGGVRSEDQEMGTEEGGMRNDEGGMMMTGEKLEHGGGNWKGKQIPLHFGVAQFRLTDRLKTASQQYTTKHNYFHNTTQLVVDTCATQWDSLPVFNKHATPRLAVLLPYVTVLWVNNA